MLIYVAGFHSDIRVTLYLTTRLLVLKLHINYSNALFAYLLSQIMITLWIRNYYNIGYLAFIDIISFYRDVPSPCPIVTRSFTVSYTL